MSFITNPLSQDIFISLKEKSLLARAAILKMTTLANSGHPGGSMSSIDLLITLYELMHKDPTNPLLPERDRLVVSNGHISPAVYSTLALNGFFTLEEAIIGYRTAESIFEGHIERDVPGIEWGTGNLGQGLSAACGFALACRLKKIENQIFCLMGDGEQQKGQLSEARRFAKKYELNNITAIIDYNQLQIGGSIHKVMPQNIKDNYRSDGWQVLECNGHDHREIAETLQKAVATPSPTLILAHTIMGKGVSFMQNLEKYHGSTLSESQLGDALAELDVENDFIYYKEFKEITKFKKVHKDFSLPITLKKSFPQEYDKPTDNRSAFGNALANIAKANPENPAIAVFDCDLEGSVKTNDFNKLLPHNFFQGGIMEHNTAVIAGAMSVEGFQAFFADFGVFGVDETYNQHRLTDINQGNIKVITTHVGLDVGEDGKTHQCIDYLGLMKNLFHFKTIIPGDPNQTDHVIRYIAEQFGNFYVPMGRSKLPILRNSDAEIFYHKDYQFTYGKADLLRDGDVGALLVCGTLTPTAVNVVDALAEDNIFLQLWNISCPNDIDMNALFKAASTGVIFTLEDHNIHTGMGSDVANALLKLKEKCHLIKMGVKDYAISGPAELVYKHCGLDQNSIINQIKSYYNSK